jgi:valyl-tRNA synthetase
LTELTKIYEPRTVEERWYQFWLDEGCFVADASSGKPSYSIVIPPPNVTGVLTLGHVLNNTIQDILARKARMEGKEVLWLPGTDHAGIATQAVVERTSVNKAPSGTATISDAKFPRDGLGMERETRRHHHSTAQETRRLLRLVPRTIHHGPEYSRCVQRVFVDLHRKGLIYRGKPHGQLGPRRAHRSLR